MVMGNLTLTVYYYWTLTVKENLLGKYDGRDRSNELAPRRISSRYPGYPFVYPAARRKFGCSPDTATGQAGQRE